MSSSGSTGARKTALGWRKKLLFSLVPLAALAALLIAAEGIARLAGLQPFPDIPFMDSRLEMEWEMRPNARSVWGNERIVVETNSRGFRSKELAQSKPDDEYRILFLGDSIVFGFELPVEHAIPQLLEELLNSRDDPRRFEVINAGVEGYNLYSSYYNLYHKGLQLEPDLILLGFVLNDVYEPYTNMEHYGAPGQLFWGRRTFLGSIKGILRKTAIFSALEMQYISRVVLPAVDVAPYELANMFHEPLPPELDEAWSEALHQLDRIQELADENDIPLVVISFPARYQVRRDPNYLLPVQQLHAHARSNRIALFDLLPGLLKTPDPPTLYRLESGADRYDEVHFNARGNGIIAGMIERMLAETGILNENGGDPHERLASWNGYMEELRSLMSESE